MNQILVLFFTFIFTTVSIACDCDWAGDFLTEGLKQDLVVKVKIIDHFEGDPEVQQVNVGVNERMTVQIIKIYKGKEIRNIITIWGDNGALCRPYVDYFKKGQEYFLALTKMGNDYLQSNCGEYYLTIKNGKVKSELDLRPELPQIGEMDLQEFEKMLIEN